MEHHLDVDLDADLDVDLDDVGLDLDAESTMEGLTSSSGPGCASTGRVFPPDTTQLLENLYTHGMTGWDKAHTRDIDAVIGTTGLELSKIKNWIRRKNMKRKAAQAEIISHPRPKKRQLTAWNLHLRKYAATEAYSPVTVPTISSDLLCSRGKWEVYHIHQTCGIHFSWSERSRDPVYHIHKTHGILCSWSERSRDPVYHVHKTRGILCSWSERSRDPVYHIHKTHGILCSWSERSRDPVYHVHKTRGILCSQCSHFYCSIRQRCHPFIHEGDGVCGTARGAVSTAVTNEVIDLTGKSAQHMLNCAPWWLENLNLFEQDRVILEVTDWLKDNIVQAAQTLLKRKRRSSWVTKPTSWDQPAIQTNQTRIGFCANPEY